MKAKKFLKNTSRKEKAEKKMYYNWIMAKEFIYYVIIVSHIAQALNHGIKPSFFLIDTIHHSLTSSSLGQTVSLHSAYSTYIK